MSELHSNLMILTPLQCLEEIRKLISAEDAIVVISDRDTSVVKLYWDHHDGSILELEGEEKPTLTAAIVDFNLKWVEMEREADDRRRREGTAETASALSILPGYVRDNLRPVQD